MMLGSLVTCFPAMLIGGLRLAYYARPTSSRHRDQTVTALSLS